VVVGLGPHAPYSVGKEWWLKLRELAAKHDLLVQTHLSETREEVEKAKMDWGTTPVQFLENLALLNSQMLAAHCVWVTDKDIQTLRKRQVQVLHCPQSNLKTAAGIAPVARMLAAGINVSVGTDGAASNNNLDMLEELRTAAMLQKHLFSADAMNNWQALECITVNPARAAGLENRMGMLEVDKEADIVILSTNKPHMTPRKNQLSNLIYSANGSDVETVIVAGRIVMENRKILTVNEDEVLEAAARAANKIS
jgi:5-methylthioadenosine/S-adenosylhomocysteine deaminase